MKKKIILSSLLCALSFISVNGDIYSKEYGTTWNDTYKDFRIDYRILKANDDVTLIGLATKITFHKPVKSNGIITFRFWDEDHFIIYEYGYTIDKVMHGNYSAIIEIPVFVAKTFEKIDVVY